MKPQGPCKDCPDRHTACHDECEKYKDFKAKLDEQRRQYRLDNIIRPKKKR